MVCYRSVCLVSGTWTSMESWTFISRVCPRCSDPVSCLPMVWTLQVRAYRTNVAEVYLIKLNGCNRLIRLCVKKDALLQHREKTTRHIIFKLIFGRWWMDYKTWKRLRSPFHENWWNPYHALSRVDQYWSDSGGDVLRIQAKIEILRSDSSES